VFACLAGGAFTAEQPTLIQNVTDPQTVALGGQWRTIVGPYQSGYPDYRYRPYADAGMGANKKRICGERKTAFYVLRDHYRSLAAAAKPE
jgi:hypothetical protein